MGFKTSFLRQPPLRSPRPHPTSVSPLDRSLIEQEILVLLCKRAIEEIPHDFPGFRSRLFTIPKKMGSNAQFSIFALATNTFNQSTSKCKRWHCVQHDQLRRLFGQHRLDRRFLARPSPSFFSKISHWYETLSLWENFAQFLYHAAISIKIQYITGNISYVCRRRKKSIQKNRQPVRCSSVQVFFITDSPRCYYMCTGFY